MGTWTLTFDIIKTGLVLAAIVGIVALIIWAFIRNIKWLFGSRKADKELVDWFIVGLNKGYDDDELMKVVLMKSYKPKKADKALKEAYKIMIREEEKENAKRIRGLGSHEEEIEGFKKEE